MKKIAVDTVRGFLKEYKNECWHDIVKTYSIGDSTFDVVFNINLSVDERDLFVQRVVSGSFDLSGQYHDELFHAMLHATVLQMCTNLPALALKGERTDDGQAVLDLDQMDVLFGALKTDSLPDEFQSFYARMKNACVLAVQEKKQYLLYENSSSAAVRDFVFSIRDLITRVSSLVTDENLRDLMSYAETLQGIANTIGRDDITNKVIEINRNSDE